MHTIILHLLQFIQYQYTIIRWLLCFIVKFVPLKQWLWDDSHSPKYQKFKVDELPIVIQHHWDWKFDALQDYYRQRYGKTVAPIRHRTAATQVPDSCTCPRCGAVFRTPKESFEQWRAKQS